MAFDGSLDRVILVTLLVVDVMKIGLGFSAVMYVALSVVQTTASLLGYGSLDRDMFAATFDRLLSRWVPGRFGADAVDRSPRADTLLTASLCGLALISAVMIEVSHVLTAGGRALAGYYLVGATPTLTSAYVVAAFAAFLSIVVLVDAARRIGRDAPST